MFASNNKLFKCEITFGWSFVKRQKNIGDKHHVLEGFG